jgi:fused signal recognition particle receptor
MARLFKKAPERKKGIWRRVVDLALTDVRVLATGMDHESLETLEERLLAADFGVPATLRLVGRVEDAARRGKVRGSESLRDALRAEIRDILAPSADAPLAAADGPPTVYLVVGVNGVGKTTSIAKLTKLLKDRGHRVLLCAADTFRAAAVEQLTIWSERTGVEIVKQPSGSDPASVAYDAADAAVARGADYLIIDTAGRLHTQKNLMQELEKIRRVLTKRIPDAPHEVIQVIDATTGQNAIQQVLHFNEAIHVTGLFLSKLDGTAKGGVVIGIRQELPIPVKFIGVGERPDDIERFDADQFVEALFA